MDTRSLNEIAEKVEVKMLYMCGCQNCIRTVKNIITDDVKPFDSQCDTCQIQCRKNRLIFPHTIGDITFYNVTELIEWVENQQMINKERLERTNDTNENV